MKKFVCASLVTAFALAPISAFAADIPQAATANPNSQANAPKAKSQNDVVCETEEVTGTRLGSKRVCATRSEWQQRQQGERQDISKTQTQVGISPTGG